MPEMKNNFQAGRMNKDLDERLVPNGEYRDALNVEIATSNDSDMGSLQTLKGNTFLGVDGVEGVCIGSIADDKNDKLYFMVAGDDRDIIIEYNHKEEEFLPVCVDHHSLTGLRALNFNADFLITGINIIDDLLFWTDNNSEPKKINITRGKLGCLFGSPQMPSYTNHTKLMVRNTAPTAPNPPYVTALDQSIDSSGNVIQPPILIQEEHLTVIKKGPSAAPVLEMIDTLSDGMIDGDGLAGGSEISAAITNGSSLTFLGSDGEFLTTIWHAIQVSSGMDFPPGAFLNIYKTDDRSINIRVKIHSIPTPYPGLPTTPTPAMHKEFNVLILSGSKEIEGEEDLTVELEQADALFQFKFPRFAYRYKYEDGEYSCFSPFTEPAFIPGKFNYLPKEGYNLGMINRLRRLAIKDFVHERSMPKSVIAVDILYKESNSPNIYSIKTIKRIAHNSSKWDAWNGNSASSVVDIGNPQPGGTAIDAGWKGITKGYLPITSEMIHATLPANQLLRPWDNVPRKALAQEVIGNRLVYGNYLQNYDLKKTIYVPGPNNIKVEIKAGVSSVEVKNTPPEELHAGERIFLDYNPAKSVKTLRTYQLGVVYIDKHGRETPVFSEDARGATSGENTSESSVYVKKELAGHKNQLKVQLKNNPPDWATHFKIFVKETSNEYYNLAMDRCYDAEDGNVWLSFPSAERNKVDEETFLILKKIQDGSDLVPEPAKYKIIAIENEAPRFIKLKNISMGAIQDDAPANVLIGTASDGFPFEDKFYILMDATAFDNAKWDNKLMNQNISQVFIRVKAIGAVSLWYRLKQVTLISSGAHYKLEVDKQFGPEMTITSPDNTWNNRVKNCTIEIVKRIPEDRAEFEGRFFVKILKDGVIKETVCPDISLDANWIPTSSMPVQYIDPRALENHLTTDPGNGYIDTGMHNGGAWYGFNKYDLSIDPIHTSYNTSSAPGLVGDGVAYWGLASDDTSNDRNPLNQSSGWFIDNVEAFRIYRGDMEGVTKDVQHQWYAEEYHRTELAPCWSGTTNSQNWNNLNVLGINTYGGLGTANTYLTHPDTRPPASTADNVSLIRRSTCSRGNGGGIAPSTGIDADSGIINLSYAGLNLGARTTQEDYTGNWEDTGKIHEQSVFKEDSKHAGDLGFIEKLIQPGTVWRWKEDPDQIKYITVLNTDFSDPLGPYQANEWNNENNGDLDGEAGVALFNYAVLADYFLKTNHYAEWKECGTWTDKEKSDFVSRNIPDHSYGETGCWCFGLGCGAVWNGTHGCSLELDTHSASRQWGAVPWSASHKRFPMGVYDWDHQRNKRRRYAFKSEVFEDGNGAVKGGPLGSGDHRYLPTNDPDLPAHFDNTASPITANPNTGVAWLPSEVAPGIRNDGMCVGFAEPTGDWDFDPGDGLQTPYSTEIPQIKQWDASSTAVESPMPGSVTWQIMEPFTETDDRLASKNPAVWETEPKEDVGLDIYHEVGQIYPIHLDENTIEQHVGAIGLDANKNSFVTCWDSGATLILMTPGVGTVLNPSPPFPSIQDIRVIAADGDFVMLGSLNSDGVVVPLNENQLGHVTPNVNSSSLIFWRADGSSTVASVNAVNTPGGMSGGTWYKLGPGSGEVGVHNHTIWLPWFNCYSFGNGVESDRIRDDYNQVTIDNGPKASTTLEEPYLEERRKNGFIWSGLYNSISGVNNTNQFIQAEKITKDVNPSYGSIQKLFARDSDLVAFCEDRVLKVLANKDALYNADGNTNLISTDRVLGNIKPFIGDYGISLNPESFASDSYRSYFSDSSRGAILRLSQDGLTPISDAGMHDWFADKLALIKDNKIIGSFDDNKGEYNITIQSLPPSNGNGSSGSSSSSGSGSSSSSSGYGSGSGSPSSGFSSGSTSSAQLAVTQQQPPLTADTLSFSEKSKGWVSFKSWNQENGISLNNSYYTFSGGQMFQHHTNEIRNNFYYPGSPALLEDYQFESSVDILFNQIPGSIKSFSTLNYEGSQAKVTPEINNNPDYYDNFPKDGWYVSEMISNAQELGEMEFWDKEDKWFSQIKGVATEWLNDGTAGNIDPREFSYQGIGNSDHIDCPDCPEVTTWDCGPEPATPPTPPQPAYNECDGLPILGDLDSFMTVAFASGNQNTLFQNIGVFTMHFRYNSTNAISVGSSLGNPIAVAYQEASDAYGSGSISPWTYCPDNNWTGLLLPGVTTPAISRIINFGGAGNPITSGAESANEFITDLINAGWSVSQGDSWVNIIAESYNQLSTWDQVIFPVRHPYLDGSPVGGACKCSDAIPGNPGNPGGDIICLEVIGTGGEYQTEQLCLDDGCGAPELWGCYDGNCYETTDGSGNFANYCDCVMSIPISQSTSGSAKAAPPQFCCNEGEAYLYTCQNIPSPTTLVYGCMDDGITNDPFITQQRPNGWIGQATNYSLSHNVHDCSCSYITTQCLVCNTAGADNTVPGCCDPNNSGYDPAATCNDGSCIPLVYGCTDCGDPSNAGCLTGYDQTWWDLVQFAGQSYADITGIPTYPGTMALNYYAGANIDDGSCLYPSIPQPCPEFTHNWSVEVNNPSANCSNTFATWTWFFPTWQSGDSWEYSITNDSNGVLVIGSTSPITVGNGGGTINPLAAGNYTVTITHTLVSGQVCIYTFPIEVICTSIPNPSWDCTYFQGSFICVDPGTGLGQYPTQALCLADPISDCLVPGTSIDCTDFTQNWQGCYEWDAIQAGTSQYTLAQYAQIQLNSLLYAGYTHFTNGNPLDLAGMVLLIEECCCVPELYNTFECQSYINQWTAQGQNVYSTTGLYYPGQVVSYLDPAVGIVNYFIASSVSGTVLGASFGNPQLYPPPIAVNLWNPNNIDGVWEGCDTVGCD